MSGRGSKTLSRQNYRRMLKDTDMGHFDTILIHKYDRVARSLDEHVSLDKKRNDKGVELIAVAQDFGNSTEAKIMRTLMWSLSELRRAGGEDGSCGQSGDAAPCGTLKSCSRPMCRKPSTMR